MKKPMSTEEFISELCKELSITSCDNLRFVQEDIIGKISALFNNILFLNEEIAQMEKSHGIEIKHLEQRIEELEDDLEDQY